MPATPRGARRTWLGAAVAAALGLVLSGCGLRLQANHLVVRIDASGMRLVQVNGSSAQAGATIPAGETVIDVINADPKLAHTVSLVQGFATPAALPQQVRSARLVSDDPDQILDMSEPLDADKITISATGGIIDDPKTTQFHEYLAAGEPYLVVDVAHAAQDWLAITTSSTA